MAPKASQRKMVVAVSNPATSQIKKTKHIAPIVVKKGSKYTNWVDSARTKVDDIVVSWVTKFNKNESMFIAPMIKAFHDSDGQTGKRWGVCAFMYRRNPLAEDGEDSYLPSRDGSDFGWDCIISERCDETDRPSTLGQHIADEFTEFAVGVPDYRIHPTFTFRNDVTARPPKPLNYYLCDSDCVKLLKRFYANKNAREVVMENDDIMDSFFGSVELGRQMLEAVSDEAWSISDEGGRNG